MSIPSISLDGARPSRAKTGVEIPQLGFGTYQIPDDEVEAAIESALAVGYRHIDTAAIYGNEEGVGRALHDMKLPREQVFVTTKIWNDRHGPSQVRKAFLEQMERLGLQQLDLLLLHWPVPSQDEYVGAWEQLLDLREGGTVRQVGVCNFHAPHLQRIIDATGEAPAINQIELHPFLQQKYLRDVHAEHGIVTQAWSPLGQGGQLLEDATLREIGESHGKNPAQVALRWQVQLGHVVIPKSVTPERIRGNYEIFDFELTDEQMTRIAGLDREDGRIGPNPDEFDAR